MPIVDGPNVETFLSNVDAAPSPTHDDDLDAVMQITGTISAPTTGVCTFAITKVQTTQFTGDYYYDVEVYKTSPADVKTVVAGKFTIIWDVTRTSA